MKTEFPKWFRYSSPPGYKPNKPPEKIWQYKEISTITTSEYDYTELHEFPAGANCITVKVGKDYYDSSITGVQLVFCFKYEAPNPHYNSQLKDYEKRLEEYNTQRKEWKKHKKIWDEEQDAKGKEDRRKQYQKLKKEFDNG